jgi:hypothetical protein
MREFVLKTAQTLELDELTYAAAILAWVAALERCDWALASDQSLTLHLLLAVARSRIREVLAMLQLQG